MTGVPIYIYISFMVMSRAKRNVELIFKEKTTKIW